MRSVETSAAGAGLHRSRAPDRRADSLNNASMRRVTAHRRLIMASAFAAFSAFSLCQAGASDFKTVRVGDGPYIEFATFRTAHALGLDHEQGLDLTFEVIPTIPALQLVRGEINVGYSSSTGGMAFYKQVPGYQDFMIHNVFKGFAIVAKPGRLKPYSSYIAKAKDLNTAKVDFVEHEMLGKSLCLYDAAYRGSVEGVMKQAGRTVNDLKIVAFPDDVTGANAFLSGACDMYIGALPQVVRMLGDYPEEAEVAAPQQAFGPGEDGILFYETYAANADWLKANKATAVKLWAIELRLVELLKADPDGMSKQLAAQVRDITGVKLSDGAVKTAFTKQLLFLGVDDVEPYALSPTSSRYYPQTVEILGQQTKDVGQLPQDIKVEDHYIIKDVWESLINDKDLVAWIKSPLKK
jgi:hypothetical protein